MWIVSAPDLKFRSSVKLSMIKFEFGKSPIHLHRGSCSIWYSRFERQVPEYTIYLTLPSTLLRCTFFPTVEHHPSGLKSIGRMSGCSVERRRLPLVAAVQWRIVSLSNQRPVLDLPFSPSLQTLSRLYDASYATNAEENARRSEWIGETYAVRLFSLPLHRFIGESGEGWRRRRVMIAAQFRINQHHKRSETRRRARN